MVSRYECLRSLAEIMGDDVLVLIWGSAGEEWWHLRPHPPSVNMPLGYATPAGLGLALALPHRQVIVIDTDGSILFNMGVLATLGNIRPPNLKVIVMDNECYESIGAMPSATAGRTDLAAVAKGAGIEHAETTRTLEQFTEVATRALSADALYFVVAKTEKGAKKLPPHFTDAVERKYKFIRYIEETEKIHIITPTLQRTPEHLLRQ